MSTIQTAFIPPRSTGLQINNWRIQSPVTPQSPTISQAAPEQSELAPRDQFVSGQASFTSIKHIHVPQLALQPPGFTLLNFNQQASVELTKSSLFKQLTQAFTQNSSLEFSHQAQSLVSLASQIGMFIAKAPEANTDAVPQIINTDSSAQMPGTAARDTNPRIRALRQQSAAHMAQTMERFEGQLARGDSPRMKKLCRLLMEGLEVFQKDLETAKGLSPQQQQKGAMALALTQALGHMHSTEPAKQGILLQQWALLMEDLSQQGKLTPQAMIQAAQELSGTESRLQSDTEEVMDLLGGKGLMQTNLADAGVEMFQTMQDMTPAELGQLAKASQSFVLDFKQYVLPNLKALQNERFALEQHELGLSPETQSLIDQADELALRLVLNPEPEPPKGFEDGVLSLLQQFNQIIRQLQADQQVLQAEQAAQIIQQRSLDKQFLGKLLESKQYDQTLRSQNEQLQEHVSSRYQSIASALHEALQQSQQFA